MTEDRLAGFGTAADTMERALGLRERHQRLWPVDVDGSNLCCHDDEWWPCDAIQQADRADAAEAMARELAGALNESARETHAYGNVRDHWADPITGKWGDGPVDFDVCTDASCMEPRRLLRRFDAEYGR